MCYMEARSLPSRFLLQRYYILHILSTTQNSNHFGIEWIYSLPLYSLLFQLLYHSLLYKGTIVCICTWCDLR